MPPPRRIKAVSPSGPKDASRAVLIFATIALVAIFGAVFLIRLSEVMPFGMWLLVAVSTAVAVIACCSAIFARAYSTPTAYHPGPPVLKPRRMRPLRSSNGHRPHRPDQDANVARKAS